MPACALHRTDQLGDDGDVGIGVEQRPKAQADERHDDERDRRNGRPSLRRCRTRRECSDDVRWWWVGQNPGLRLGVPSVRPSVCALRPVDTLDYHQVAGRTLRVGGRLTTCDHEQNSCRNQRCDGEGTGDQSPKYKDDDSQHDQRPPPPRAHGRHLTKGKPRPRRLATSATDGARTNEGFPASARTVHPRCDSHRRSPSRRPPAQTQCWRAKQQVRLGYVISSKWKLGRRTGSVAKFY